MKTNEFLTMSEAARAAGLSEPALRRRVQRGELTVYADPLDWRRRLIRSSDLAGYLAGRRAIPVAAMEGHAMS